MALTLEQIHAAADTLAAQGQRPTLAAVRAALGGGSFTTIGEALKTWRQAQTEEHALADVQVPDAVAERTQALQAAIWQAAVAEAEARVQAEREALKATMEAATGEVAEAKEAVTTLEAEAAQAQAEIERLRAELASAEARARRAEAGEQAAQARLESAAREISAAEARAEKSQARAERAIEEAGELRGKLEALASR